MPNRVILFLVLLSLCIGCKTNNGNSQISRSLAGFNYAKDSLDKTYNLKRKVLGKRSEKKVFSSIFADKANALRFAYNRRLKDHPGILGWVVFRFQIVSSGQVTGCKVIESQIDDKLLLEQLTTEITKWNFKPVQEADTTVVVFPFCFCS